MEPVLDLLAALGCVAVALRAGRSVLRALRWGAECVFADEIAETRAQRGDVTGMREATAMAIEARHGRRVELIRLGVLLLLLLGPVATPWPRTLYVGYAFLAIGAYLFRGDAKG